METYHQYQCVNGKRFEINRTPGFINQVQHIFEDITRKSIRSLAKARRNNQIFLMWWGKVNLCQKKLMKIGLNVIYKLKNRTTEVYLKWHDYSRNFLNFQQRFLQLSCLSAMKDMWCFLTFFQSSLELILPSTLTSWRHLLSPVYIVYAMEGHMCFIKTAPSQFQITREWMAEHFHDDITPNICLLTPQFSVYWTITCRALLVVRSMNTAMTHFFESRHTQYEHYLGKQRQVRSILLWDTGERGV